MLARQRPLAPRHATVTHVLDSQGDRMDEVVATYFPAPHSYTGEHLVEISAHGSPVLLRAIVARACEVGARLATPGEFTLRAFLNGKKDLIQAEAVADLIEAATPTQARTAFDQLEGTLTEQIAELDADLFSLIARLEASLDFPDEGFHFIQTDEVRQQTAAVAARLDVLLASARRGRLIREGAAVAVVGRPNVGKSSVFNMLAGAERAIVAPSAGTTRDLVTEQIELEGLALTLVDTAGWRETSDEVEREGVTRAERTIGVADLLLLVLDASERLRDEDERLIARTNAKRRLLVANKTDLPRVLTLDADIRISARTGDGAEQLRSAMIAALAGHESLRDAVPISNMRHISLLQAARVSLGNALRLLDQGDATEEFVLSDLQVARGHMEEMVGKRTSDDLLAHIFSRFCVGK
jgi:tRNA modification GTPase